jgi:hypothetical protein
MMVEKISKERAAALETDAAKVLRTRSWASPPSFDANLFLNSPLHPLV